MASNQIAARMVFENARALANNLGYNLSEARCTQSFLRSEITPNTTSTNYRVPILVNDTAYGSITATEQRLNLQDIFYTSELFIGLYSQDAASQVFKLFTYSNSFFGATQPFNTLWQGKFNVIVNNQNILPAWDIARHYVAPRTQSNTNFNVASPTSPAVFTQDSADYSSDGFVAVEPGWILNGAANINATINLGTALTSAGPSNTKIVVIQRGILIQNATTVK